MVRARANRREAMEIGLWRCMGYRAARPEAFGYGRDVELSRVFFIEQTFEDEEGEQCTTREAARALPLQSWHTVSWRDGTKGQLSSRFARVRVCAANEDLVRQEEWLLIEWPHGEAEPRHYWMSTLGEKTSFRTLVFNAMGRWMI